MQLHHQLYRCTQKQCVSLSHSFIVIVTAILSLDFTSCLSVYVQFFYVFLLVFLSLDPFGKKTQFKQWICFNVLVFVSGSSNFRIPECDIFYHCCVFWLILPCEPYVGCRCYVIWTGGGVCWQGMQLFFKKDLTRVIALYLTRVFSPC